jgi:hypothetical protein
MFYDRHYYTCCSVFDKCDAFAAISDGVVPSENHIEHHTTSAASFATAVDNSLVCGIALPYTVPLS